MNTKRGACNRETGHFWFNVELTRRHLGFLKYIVVHEIAHYFGRNHRERFIKLMDRYMPDWRIRRDRLNGEPLGNEEW